MMSFRGPEGVEFLDEQKHPVSREEREEHELLGHVSTGRGVGTVQQREV